MLNLNFSAVRRDAEACFTRCRDRMIRENLEFSSIEEEDYRNDFQRFAYRVMIPFGYCTTFEDSQGDGIITFPTARDVSEYFRDFYFTAPAFPSYYPPAIEPDFVLEV